MLAPLERQVCRVEAISPDQQIEYNTSAREKSKNFCAASTEAIARPIMPQKKKRPPLIKAASFYFKIRNVLTL